MLMAWALNIARVPFIRASPAVLSMQSCTVQLDEEKSKHAGLAQEIGFGSA
jgi:hypothetical protein